MPLRLELTGRVAAGGDVIGRLEDGRVAMVEGALPGETVTAEVTEEHRDFALARALAVERRHPDRVTPPCPHVARGCGGCQFQHAAVSLQRRMKEAIVADALRRIGRLDEAPAPVTVPLPADGYRTTVHLAVDDAGRPAYRRRRRHETVAVDSCLVAHPALEELIVAGRFPGQQRVTLRVGVAGGERLAVLDGPGVPAPDVPGDVTVVGPRQRAHFHEDAGGRRWRVSARAFFQAGPLAATALAETVDAALGDAGGTLVDLYAGVGLLGGVAASRRGGRLVAVERHREASADARANLADLDAEVVTALVGAWRPRRADAVIADPARPGLGRPGVAAVSATGAARLVLVSCDPASLGRDAGLLARDGWELTSVRLVDAFPHTAHVEVVSRFDQGSARQGGDVPPVP